MTYILILKSFSALACASYLHFMGASLRLIWTVSDYTPMNTSIVNSVHVNDQRSGKHRVIIVEDQRMMAEFYGKFCAELGLNVLMLCGTCAEALVAIRRLQPDLLLLDFSLPDGDGLELAERITSELPRVKIIAVSFHRDPWTMLRVHRSRLHGFVDKSDDPPSVLSTAIHAVIAGGTYFSPIVRQASEKIRRNPDAFFRILSDHEIGILSLVGQTKSDEEIGVILAMSSLSVQSLRCTIMRRLGVPTVPKLIHYAIANGLTRADYFGSQAGLSAKPVLQNLNSV